MGGVDRAALRKSLVAWTEDTPVNLAVFRIVVGLVLLRLPDLHGVVAFSRLPDRVRTAPVGLDAALGTLPMGPDVAVPLYYIVVGATVLGVVGWMSRAAWTVVAVGGLYLLAIPQFAGSVFHYHHLVWFAALLAVSPCGDALSVDAWWRRRRGGTAPPARALAYGVPLRAAWLLIGVIFFFPGVHKLATGGWAWIASDNLRNQMYAKWAQMAGFRPLFRIDRVPGLVNAGALATVLFELSFIFLVCFRRTRWIAVSMALVFHQATAYFMGLRFGALWFTYVVFVDWSALAAWLRRRWDKASTPSPAVEAGGTSSAFPRVAMGLAAVLLVGNLVAGATGQSDAWPFACYPKFHRLVRARLPRLRVELVYADGNRTRTVPDAAMNPGGATQRWWAVMWSLMGAHERARASPARWQAFWRQIRGRPAVRAMAEGASEVRFHRDVVSTVPEEADRPPLRTQLLYALPLGSDR